MELARWGNISVKKAEYKVKRIEVVLADDVLLLQAFIEFSHADAGTLYFIGYIKFIHNFLVAFNIFVIG